MISTVLTNLIKNREVKRSDIEVALFEICDDEHSSCNFRCPVYELNGGKAPNDEDSRYGCSCFKNGKKMYAFIEEHAK